VSDLSESTDEVSRAVVDRLEAICSRLPDAYAEEAWIGMRWRIRKRTFAHVFRVGERRSEAFRAFRFPGAATVLTFRADGEDRLALTHAGWPFYHPGWGRDVVGMVLTDDVDWDEVAELLTDSYCLLAPKGLAARVRASGLGLEA
jgi:predicted DNA-binding protein (MmcQ/YjbR family)